MTDTPSADSAYNAGPATSSRSAFLRVVSWTFTMDAGGQAVSLVVSFTLAALLGPRTYGVVAMAIVYVGFVQVLQRQGMAAAIIQRKELTEQHLNTAFWLVLSMSSALAGASILLAGWWAGLNRLPELRPIIIALSALIVLEALTAVQGALLTRRMKFKSLTLRKFASVSAGGVAGVAGALAGWGPWAIVAQHLTAATVSLAVLWAVSSWRPRFRTSKRAARDLLGFSTGSTFSSIGVFINNRSDVLLIGLFFGPVVVGIYQLASRLVDTVVAISSKPVQTLALPELSPHQDDSYEFGRRLRRLMQLTAITAIPALGLLAGSAAPLVQLLGPDWSGTTGVLQVLCGVGLVRILIALDGPLLQAQGRPFVQAGLTWISALISSGTFISAGLLLQDLPSDIQPIMVATARFLIYGILIMLIHLYIIRRFTALTVPLTAALYAIPLLAGFISSLVGTSVAILLRPLPALGLLVVTGLSSALAAVVVLICGQPHVKNIFATQFLHFKSRRR